MNEDESCIEDKLFLSEPIQRAMKILQARSTKECNYYSETVPLDNYELFYKDEKRFSEAVKTLNFYPTDFVFEIGGDAFRPDLIITSKRLRKAYDKIPKTKTVRDVLNAVDKDWSIQSDIGFHADLDKKITDEEYDQMYEAYHMVAKIFDSTFNEDDSDDDL